MLAAPTRAAIPLAAPSAPSVWAGVGTAPGTAVTGDVRAAEATRPASPGRWRVALALSSLAVAAAAVAAVGAHRYTTRRAAAARPPRSRRRRRRAEVGAGSPMIAMPGAIVAIGSDTELRDERPVHDASLTTFFVDKDEVTVERYARCVAAGGCTRAGTDVDCNAGRPGREHHPINCVTHAQAAAYCGWLGRRLPTEDEWEYAAGGKQKRRFAWGDAPPEGRACVGRGEAGTCEGPARSRTATRPRGRAT